MAISQIQAVTGRKLRPGYVSAINAMVPYLPQQYAQEKADEYQDELYDLREEELALQEQGLRRSEKFAEENLDEQKKQAQAANKLALANLGVATGLGLAREYGLPGLSPGGSSAVETAAPAVAAAGTLAQPAAASVGPALEGVGMGLRGASGASGGSAATAGIGASSGIIAPLAATAFGSFLLSKILPNLFGSRRQQGWSSPQAHEAYLKYQDTQDPTDLIDPYRGEPISITPKAVRLRRGEVAKRAVDQAYRMRGLQPGTRDFFENKPAGYNQALTNAYKQTADKVLYNTGVILPEDDEAFGGGYLNP